MNPPAYTPDLAAVYQDRFDAMVIRPEHEQECRETADRIAAWRDRYAPISEKSNVPWQVIGVIHSLECGLSFNAHLHNGDSLARRTHNDPAGRPLADPTGPDGRYTFEESALDALRYDKFTTWPVWDLPSALFNLERYNGWGYFLYHPKVPTPYLWSFTNHYSSGKYVADGKFDPEAVSAQVGCAPLLKLLGYQ